ncbi:MAG TPA: amidase family protein, partial [bacterium]|nr:amidase family protein [bacterium]
MSASDLCFLPATQLAEMIRKGSISCLDLMQATWAQIDRVNPQVNAIVTRIPYEQALEQARQADQAVGAWRFRGGSLGPLHGLPIACKDLVQTRGIRTTKGSPIYQDWVPDVDALIVERLKAAGAIVIGKTNTPEFGLGSHTFNEVFGATRNAYDQSRSAGGSSGGAAVALATRMV